MARKPERVRKLGMPVVKDAKEFRRNSLAHVLCQPSTLNALKPRQEMHIAVQDTSVCLCRV